MIRNWVLALFLLGTCVYSPTFRNGFVVDDHDEVERNRHIASLKSFPEYFLRPFWQVTADKEMASNIYRPIKLVSYAVERLIGGSRPLVFHVGNLIYHLIATSLLFLFLIRTGATPTIAFFASAFFLLHSANSEVVYYISGRPDSLAAIFFLLSLLSLESPLASRIILGALLFLCALLSKEVALVLLPAVGFYLLKRKSRPRIAFVSIAVSCVLYQWLKVKAEIHTPTGILLSFFRPEMWRILVEYIRLLVFPFEPLGYRLLPNPVPVWRDVAAVGVIFGFGFWVFRKKTSWLPVFGVLIAVPSLVLASSLSLHSGLLSDRYLYFPVLGIVLMMASTIKSFDSITTKSLATAILVIFGAFSFVAHSQWKDDLAFWSFAAQAQPTNATIERNLGATFLETGRSHEARVHLKRSETLAESSRSERKTYLAAIHSLAALDYREGNLEGAHQGFERLVRLVPDSAEYWKLLGVILLQMKKCEDLASLSHQFTKQFPSEKSLFAEETGSCGAKPKE